MNSTVKTSRHFSKLRGLQASILLFAPPRPASSCFCSLSPIFVWPECGKLLRMRMLTVQATLNLCWTLTFTLTFTIHGHCHSHRQHSLLPVTITINCHCHCHHLSLSVLSPILPSTIINLQPFPLFLHLSTMPGHDHLLLSLFILTVTS